MVQNHKRENNGSGPGYERRRDDIAVKIKVSYEHPEELRWLLDQLRPEVKSWKVSRNQEGKFRKAYVEMKEKPDKTQLCSCKGHSDLIK